MPAQIVFIDLGTTATRILFLHEDGAIESLTFREHKKFRLGNHGPQEMPSAFVIKDLVSRNTPPTPSDITIGPETWGHPHAFPIKYLFYCIGSHVPAEDYPPVAQLKEFLSRDIFTDTARMVVEMFLGKLLEECQYNLTFSTYSHPLDRTVVLAVPNIWAGETEQLYADMLEKVWDGAMGKVVIMHEIEGVAHHFKANKQAILRNKHSHHSDPRSALFFDIGGHTLNGCGYYFVESDHLPVPTLTAIGHAFAVFGGGEHYEWCVARKVEKVVNMMGDLTLRQKSQLHQSMVQSFREQKADLLYPAEGQQEHYLLQGVYQLDSGLKMPKTWYIPHKELLECFHRGFSKPLEAVERQLQQTTETNFVICSGGSLEIHYLAFLLRQMIQQHGHQIILLNEGVRGGLSNIIVCGGASSWKRAVTVKEYMAGGALGVDLRPVSKTDSDDSWTRLKLWSRGRSRPKKHTLDAESEFRLLCNPIAGLEIPAWRDMLELRGWYVVYQDKTMKLSKGIHSISAKIDLEANRLDIVVRRLDRKGEGSRTLETRHLAAGVYMDFADSALKIDVDKLEADPWKIAQGDMIVEGLERLKTSSNKRKRPVVPSTIQTRSKTALRRQLGVVEDKTDQANATLMTHPTVPAGSVWLDLEGFLGVGFTGT